MSGIISPIGVLFLAAIYLTLVITSLYLILKNEDGYIKLFWIVLVLFIPFVGSIVYLGNHLISKNRIKI